MTLLRVASRFLEFDLRTWEEGCANEFRAMNAGSGLFHRS